jgi:hypothetical protein
MLRKEETHLNIIPATTSTSSEENTTPEGIAPPPEPQSEG